MTSFMHHTPESAAATGHCPRKRPPSLMPWTGRPLAVDRACLCQASRKHPAQTLLVQQELPHGHFVPWLRTELGRSVRLAQNFLSVVEQLRTQCATIAHLPNSATDAYFQAIPSVPEEALETDIGAAQRGELITAPCDGILSLPEKLHRTSTSNFHKKAEKYC
jgi:hypothetical protein